MMLAEEVQKDDEKVLRHLVDIKYSTKLSGDQKGFQLAFCFSPNPYFEDEILTKVSCRKGGHMWREEVRKGERVGRRW